MWGGWGQTETVQVLSSAASIGLGGNCTQRTVSLPAALRATEADQQEFGPTVVHELSVVEEGVNGWRWAWPVFRGGVGHTIDCTWVRVSIEASNVSVCSVSRPLVSRQMICHGPGRSWEAVGAERPSAESLRNTQRPWAEVSRLGLLSAERWLESPRKYPVS